MLTFAYVVYTNTDYEKPLICNFQSSYQDFTHGTESTTTLPTANVEINLNFTSSIQKIFKLSIIIYFLKTQKRIYSN